MSGLALLIQKDTFPHISTNQRFHWKYYKQQNCENQKQKKQWAKTKITILRNVLMTIWCTNQTHQIQSNCFIFTVRNTFLQPFPCIEYLQWKYTKQVAKFHGGSRGLYHHNHSSWFVIKEFYFQLTIVFGQKKKNTPKYNTHVKFLLAPLSIYAKAERKQTEKERKDTAAWPIVSNSKKTDTIHYNVRNKIGERTLHGYWY